MKAAGRTSTPRWRRAVVLGVVVLALGAGAWVLHRRGQTVASDDAIDGLRPDQSDAGHLTPPPAH